MTKRMLIDATHAEETRVVVLDGNRLEDFDVETSTKKQLKGNIYLAKIVRVEPSLQAAFVEYGGNRHGFLAFGEIHPDYYQIPIADRQRLLAQQAAEAREAEEAEEAAHADEGESGDGGAGVEAAPVEAGDPAPVTQSGSELAEVPAEPGLAEWPVDSGAGAAQAAAIEMPTIYGAAEPADAMAAVPADAAPDDTGPDTGEDLAVDPVSVLAELGLTVADDGELSGDPQALAALHDALSEDAGEEAASVFAAGDDEDVPGVAGEAEAALDAAEVYGDAGGGEMGGEAVDEVVPPAPETIGGEGEVSEERERRAPSRFLRNYKIQEVIRRRQIMLVQVVKEERGGKGAALTTYISLAGRFSVLMPNSQSGGGISRKITSAADRRRLKEITAELDIPPGMGMIVRTAGAARPKPEIKRDCEYLLQLWDDIRDTTMKSVAPAAIYEEASLIKRAIRDVYSRDIDEIAVDGEAAWRAARDQMRLLMPSHAHKVMLWQDSQPLFAHHQVEAQLDAMLSPNVQLKSGGYLVINQTEALVAIDVNSGRSTRERGIEETALRTNSEAAEEVARQLRLRDLAGLIVIDFIDMESRRNNATVERKLKDALKNDRARIQLGSISHFGLMEMSRQRLRPSLAETSFVQCAQCGGSGHVRSTEGAAIHVLRAIEEQGAKYREAEIMVHVAGPIAMYILNHKRARLAAIEARHGMAVLFTPDPTLLPPAVKIERLRALEASEVPAVLPRAESPMLAAEPEEAEDEPYQETGANEAAGEMPEETAEIAGEPAGGEASRRRRRRRRRGGRRDAAPNADESGEAGEPDTGVTDLWSTGEAGRGPDGHPDPADEAGGAITTDEPVPVPVAAAAVAADSEAEPSLPAAVVDGVDGGGTDAAEAAEGDAPRRRGRRGGRRRRKDAPEDAAAAEPQGTMYVGPTPADPFGGAFDIFDALEQAEAVAPPPKPRRSRAAAPLLDAVLEPPVVQQEEEAAAPSDPGLAEPQAPAAARPEPAGPVVQPVLVDDAPPAPRRGWWKR